MGKSARALLRKTKFLISIFFVFSPLLTFAGAGLTYHGRILKPDGQPLTSTSVEFTVQIQSPSNSTPNANCVLYQETQTIDMSEAAGAFALELGTKHGTGATINNYTDGSNGNLENVFRNKGTVSGYSCTYNPGIKDNRQIVVKFKDLVGGGTDQFIGPQTVTYVPFALESHQVSGYKAENLLRVDDPTPVNALTLSEYQKLLGVAGIGGVSPSGAVRVGTDSSTCASPIAGAIRYSGGILEFCNGTAWTALAASGAGITSLNGLTNNIQTFAIGSSGLSPAFNSTGSTHTLNIPLASAAGVSAGLLSKADYDSFSGKFSATLSSPSSGQVIRHNGMDWVNAVINAATDLTGVLPVANGGTGASSLGAGNIVIGGGTGAVTSLAAGSIGNVVYATGAATWASGTPDAAGLVDKTSTQTISGAKAFTNYIQMAAQNEVRFADADSSNYVALKSPAAVGTNVTLTLPDTAGSPGQVLTTNGTNTLSWTTPSAATGDFKADGSVSMTGTLKAAAGTEALPGYTFAGDTDTGFSSATNTISVSTAGTQRMHFNDQGGVAIGTNATLGMFTVANRESHMYYSSYSDPDGGNAYDLKLGGNQRGLAVRGQSTFLNNVGLGILSPTSRLHVLWKAGDTTDTARIGEDTASDQIAVHALSYSNMGLKAVSNTSVGAAGYSNSNSGVYGYSVSGFGVQGNSGSGASGFFSSTAAGNVAPTLATKAFAGQATNVSLFEAQDSAGTPLFQVRYDGKVGIGTTNPGNLLSVNGSADFNGNLILKRTNSTSSLFDAATLQPYVSVNTAGAESSGISIGTKLAGATLWAADIADNIYTYVPINIQASSTYLNRNVASSGAHSLAFYKKRPSGSVLTNDNLAWIPAYGHTGSGWSPTYSAAIGVRATEAHSASAAGGQLWLETTPNGTTTPQVRMTVDQTGNVGIGTITPGAGTRLKVSGQIVPGSGSIATGAVDWSLGNTISTSFDCATNITFANLRDGGSYTLVVTDAGTAQCNFSTTTTGDDAATVSYRFKPSNGARTISSHTIYSIFRAGNVVYVGWSSGW